MTRVTGRAICVALFAVVATLTLQAQPRAGRYLLQSHPWVNLHQRLLYASRFPADPPAGLSGADLATWNRAVEMYKAFVGRRNPIVDAELTQLNLRLSTSTAQGLPNGIPAAASAALALAMPIYRSRQWEEDDRANRFWIAMAEPMLASAGEELAEAHTRAYGMPFPTHIRVDVTSVAWEFGAYTVGEGDSAHAVISTDQGNQGFAALEALMHEPSHAIVGTTDGAIGADLTRASKELGLRPPSSLWHAILFYTAGELTRQALVKRGVTNYHPVVLDMYARGFGGFRKALETHWQAYLDGRMSREAAIRQIVIDTAPPKR